MKLIPSRDNICSKYASKMIVIKLNNRCNCSCSFCIDKDGFKADSINVGEIAKRANELKEYKTVFVTGGEPILDFDSVIKLLDLLRADKTYLVLNTNGTLLRPSHVEALNGQLDELQISIHHWLEAVNKQIFGYNQDIAAIKNALSRERSFSVSINSTFNNLTKPEERRMFIGKMVELCKYIGSDRLRVTELKKVDVCEFVNANDYFEPDSPVLSRSSDELITQGCTYSYNIDGIDIFIKRLCAYAKDKDAPAYSCCFVNDEGRRKIDIDTKNTFRVIYSDGSVCNSWIYNDMNKS